jgi:hypothetical protein
MNRLGKCAEILHDLFLIQQQRIHFYQQLLTQATHDAETVRFLQDISYASQAFALTLRSRLDIHLGDPADRAEVKGELYELWSREQVLEKAHSEANIAERCEHIEKATENIYMEALSACAELSHDARVLIVDQLKRIRRVIGDNRKRIVKPAAPAFSVTENGPRVYREERVYAEMEA